MLQNYPELLYFYKSEDWESLVLSYKGVITEALLADISLEIRQHFADKPKLAKKIFAIFMELAQNILYYSDEKEELKGKKGGIGIILITEHQENYRFSCGNPLNYSRVDKLKTHCLTINSLDRDGLRQFKREVRQAPPEGRSRGAGIGLIHVSLTAGNPLDVDFLEINPESVFFSLSVKINK